ncbi:MAG: hypothetical protein AAGJ46_07920 [Planctomycetota bacterium]
MTQQLADQLAAITPGGYHPGAPAAAEPTAWATMALIHTGNLAAAEKGCRWLADVQARDGSVGVSRSQPSPAWTTGLAVLAWVRWNAAAGERRYDDRISRALEWALATRGRTAEQKPQIGHDTTLVGWSWATKTHSWLEPTAIFVRALCEAGMADHPRTREGIRLLVDRLLPTGGANYGNTRVLQQWLLPHVQPSGLAMWALAGCGVDDERIALSLNYLNEQLNEPLAPASLAYACLGLAAHAVTPPSARPALAEAAGKQATQESTYKLALVTLALGSEDATETAEPKGVST